MIRYLLLSTVIVFGAVAMVAGWMNRDLIRIKIASVYADSRSKLGTVSVRERGFSEPLRGDAPWALSALPECLTQTSKSTGSVTYVQAHLPLGSVPVAPPATLIYGDCSIRIVGDEAYVRRGIDRLRIPPRAQFYRAGNLLALIRVAREGAELRVYEHAQP